MCDCDELRQKLEWLREDCKAFAADVAFLLASYCEGAAVNGAEIVVKLEENFG